MGKVKRRKMRRRLRMCAGSNDGAVISADVAVQLAILGLEIQHADAHPPSCLAPMVCQSLLVHRLVLVSLKAYRRCQSWIFYVVQAHEPGAATYRQ
jgi:hypothetical protein